MKLIWKVDQSDIVRVRAFIVAHQKNAFVQDRIETNVDNPPASISLEQFWQALVGCLLTSQQRSGPSSYVTRFLTREPFPLSYTLYAGAADRLEFGRAVMRQAKGVQFYNKIAGFLATNYDELEHGLWEKIKGLLQILIGPHSAQDEREVAEFINTYLKGFGPKQSRNLLQGLGLSQYEIPIDSRVIRWLNEFGFPINLSAGSLNDSHYYDLVSDGIQALCRSSGVLPCVLDATIFGRDD